MLFGADGDDFCRFFRRFHIHHAAIARADLFGQHAGEGAEFEGTEQFHHGSGVKILGQTRFNVKGDGRVDDDAC